MEILALGQLVHVAAEDGSDGCMPDSATEDKTKTREKLQRLYYDIRSFKLSIIYLKYKYLYNTNIPIYTVVMCGVYTYNEPQTPRLTVSPEANRFGLNTLQMPFLAGVIP